MKAEFWIFNDRKDLMKHDFAEDDLSDIKRFIEGRVSTDLGMTARLFTEHGDRWIYQASIRGYQGQDEWYVLRSAPPPDLEEWWPKLAP